MKQKFNDYTKKQLNDQQRKAVEQKDGSLLVIAGAGSGKTRVITSRIAHLMLNHDVYSHEIVALTFTNKAAKEMQERIGTFLGPDATVPFVGTFHSYCVRLLKQNQELLETPFFSIIDADDQEKIIKGIMQRANMGKQATAKQFMYQISNLKNVALEPTEREIMFGQYPQLQDVFTAYEKEKRASKVLDFDDLLHHGLKLFDNKEFQQRFQSTVRHLLVDEYQDTNVVQHALLKAMSKKGKTGFAAQSICVVGDEDQSIYSWRGATVTNMVNFKKDFPKTKLIKIEQNYRSVQSILDVANHVIKHNKQRNPKKLWSTKKGNNRISSITCRSEYQEGDAIAQFCTVAKNEIKLSNCAILYRTHFQSRAIEEALIKAAIPYKIFGGVQFYERKEIKDLLGYLRLIINPFDRPSFFRVYNTPGRGLGPAFETAFYERWSQEPFLTFVQVAQKLIEEQAVKGKKALSLQGLISVFNNINADTLPSKILETIVQRTNYIAYIKDTNELEEAQGRIDNINEFMRAINHFESEKKGNLDQFLEEVALLQEKSSKQDKQQDAIMMMTLHAAKGLEFDTVMLVGLEEGLLPSSRSLHDEDAIEEERRLFYVGITRAKERLLLSKSRYRYTYGQMSDQLPSRFLKEIPERLVVAHDIGNMQPYAIKHQFADWLNINQPDNAQVFTFGNYSTSAPSTKKTEIKRKFVKPKTNSNKSPFAKDNNKKAGPQKTFNGAWKINQPVKHKTFGIGLIKNIEEKGTKTFITVKFSTEIKKVLATFLTKI
ncbi:MAG: UvrD-helicase domain-containing protein [Candidatus Dependentiae bacterium]